MSIICQSCHPIWPRVWQLIHDQLQKGKLKSHSRLHCPLRTNCKTQLVAGMQMIKYILNYLKFTHLFINTHIKFTALPWAMVSDIDQLQKGPFHQTTPLPLTIVAIVKFKAVWHSVLAYSLLVILHKLNANKCSVPYIEWIVGWTILNVIGFVRPASYALDFGEIVDGRLIDVEPIVPHRARPLLEYGWYSRSFMNNLA